MANMRIKVIRNDDPMSPDVLEEFNVADVLLEEGLAMTSSRIQKAFEKPQNVNNELFTWRRAKPLAKEKFQCKVEWLDENATSMCLLWSGVRKEKGFTPSLEQTSLENWSRVPILIASGGRARLASPSILLTTIGIVPRSLTLTVTLAMSEWSMWTMGPRPASLGSMSVITSWTQSRTTPSYASPSSWMSNP